MGLASGHTLYGVLLIVYGLVSLLFPDLIYLFVWSWDSGWGWGWSSRDEEPSVLALLLIRALGVVALVVGGGILCGRSAQGLGGLLPF
jgi:hypothetical protein